MACISASLSPAGPRMSTTSPFIVLFCASGHDTILTTALSPGAPFLSFFLGMMMSKGVRSSCKARRATSSSISKRPTNVSFARLMISTTLASFAWSLRRAMTDTRTLSPFMANRELRSVTSKALPPSSGRNELRPLGRRMNVPSQDWEPFCRRRHDVAESRTMKSSHSISSITSIASIFWGWVENFSSRKMVFTGIVLSGLSRK